MEEKQYVNLSSGFEMPLVGLGTWLSKKGEVENAVKYALLNGYKLLDCAQAYTNEKEIGNVLHELLVKGDIKRSEIFITSKVWNTFHSYNLALNAVDEILYDLQIDYLDLCLIHWPMGYAEGKELFPKNGDKMIYSDALEKKVSEGKIRSIGLSNFNEKQIERCMQEAIKPATNAQIVLRALIQQNISVIPKSVNESRIKENIALWDFHLNENELEEFAKIDAGKRFLDLEPRDGDHIHFPYKTKHQ